MASSTIERIYPLTVTVPAGTAQATPVSVPWVTEDNTIVDIEVYVPPGHNGLTGIRIMKGDVQLLPFGANSWITANDYYRVFSIGGFVPTSDLKIQAYNTGNYPHSFYLRMGVVLYTPTSAGLGATESSALPLDTSAPASDPLSPDALIGPDATIALTNGIIQPSDLVPLDTSTIPAGNLTATGP